MARHTQFYRVSKDEKFNRFLIGQNLIEEVALKFVYKDPETEMGVEKIIPMTYIGPRLKGPMIIKKWDGDLLEYQYSGKAYYVKEEDIFNY